MLGSYEADTIGFQGSKFSYLQHQQEQTSLLWKRKYWKTTADAERLTLVKKLKGCVRHIFASLCCV